MTNWHARALVYARRQANISTGLDRFQWLVILAAIESLAAKAALPPTGAEGGQPAATKTH